MKIKSINVLVPVLVVIAALLFYRPDASVLGLAQLPEEGSVLVFSLLTAAVTWALLQLSAVLGIDLSGYANAIAAALAPIVVTAIESYLQLIPPVFDDLVTTVIHFIALLIGSLGVLWLVKRNPAPSLS